jgi:hypothetical protein
VSPAPVRPRMRGSGDTFPQMWGYWLGPALIVAGVIVAAVMVVGGIRGLVDDVNDLRRAFGGDSIEQRLEAGTEYFVYDEDGISAGPFDVTVIRASDGAEVATEEIFDGTTYDVDGRKGEARVAFNVPTSDIYRIELDTSVGQIARFAVGADVGNDRTNSIVRGVVIGSVLGLTGFAVLLWTMIVHARWKLQDAALGHVSNARRVLREQTGTEAITDSGRSAATGAVSRASSWSQERLQRVKTKLPTTDADSETDHGRAPTWQESLANQARDGIGQIEEQLSVLEPAADDAIAVAQVPGDLLDRIDEALGRVEDRVAAGDSVRDIARDEQVAAKDLARDIQARAQDAGAELKQQGELLEDAAVDSVPGQVALVSEDLTGIGADAVEDARSRAVAASDELLAGLGTTAGAAATAVAAAVVGGTDDAPGVAAPSSLPPPPPAPPPAISPEVAAPEAAAPEPVRPVIVEETAQVAKPVVEARPVAPGAADEVVVDVQSHSILAPPPVVIASAPRRVEPSSPSRGPSSRFSGIAPPPQVKTLPNMPPLESKSKHGRPDAETEKGPISEADIGLSESDEHEPESPRVRSQTSFSLADPPRYDAPKPR